MAISRQQVQRAEQWIHKVAMLRITGPAGAYPGTSSYTDFAAAMKLGPPYKNSVMDALLEAVVHHCKAQGWPDLAALVIHDAGSGLPTGPGEGWYAAHGFMIGNTKLWEQYRDDCWNRASTFTP